MCGIVGVVSACANGFSHKEMGMFAGLLFMDTIRGFDSTGVFGVHNNKNVVLHKDALHGLDFMRTKEFQSFKTEMLATGKIAVGHNRAATRGTVVDKNAHPFCVDDKIVLVQNGTYRGSHKHLKDTEVDTEAVAHVISETPDLTEALNKINASYALAWYNAETSTLNLIRNSERPLFIAAFNQKGVVFASEASMIKYAAEREEIKIEEPVALPVHTHVAITLDGKGGYTRVDTPLNIGTNFSVEDELGWFGEKYYNHRAHRHHTVAYQRETPRAQAFGRDDVKRTFVDALSYSETRKYAFETPEAALKEMELVKNNSHLGYHYVEMLDFIPANDHPDCTAWHLYGSVIGDTAGDGPCVLVHWIVYNKVDTEVLDMVVGNFYKVKIGTIINRKIPVSATEYGYIATSYASYQEVIQGLPTT